MNILHPDYISLILPFLTNTDKVNLSSTCRTLFKQIQMDRKKFQELEREYQPFKKKLLTNLGNNTEPGILYNVFAWQYYEGPMNGYGYLDGKLVFYSDRIRIFNPDSNFEIYTFYFHVSWLPEDWIENCLQEIFLMRKKSNWFGYKTGMKGNYNYSTNVHDYKKIRTRICTLEENFATKYFDVN